MNTTATGTNITPALSKDVNFTSKVEEVDSALKNRSVANKDIKVCWAKIITILTKYDIKAPIRRLDVVQASNLVNNLQVLEPIHPDLKDKERVNIALGAGYDLNQLLSKRPLMVALEKKFKGFTAWADDLVKLQQLAREGREVDEKQTDKAREELQKAVDTYIAAVEIYDDTVETVANVKEYIGVVKDVAEISAIAQGQQPKETR